MAGALSGLTAPSNALANGSDHRSRPGTDTDDPREEEMALELYQALNWNLEHIKRFASSVAHCGGCPVFGKRICHWHNIRLWRIAGLQTQLGSELMS